MKGPYSEWVKALEDSREECAKCKKYAPKESLKEGICVACELTEQDRKKHSETSTSNTL